ncbi:MAG TPA: glycine zipper family protein [Puia sp.]|jgi:hypothetical protein
MKKDLDPALMKPDTWTHARNAVNNSHNGELGVIGNEPANLLCVQLPYTFIGAINIIAEKWAVFSTDNTNSEIGLFDEILCSYKKIINDTCLRFKTTNLITGESKKNFDCTYSVYFDDGLNPSRYLNIDRPVYTLKSRQPAGSCVIPEYTTTVDCQALRLARILDTPGVTLQKGASGGSLPNGSYQVVVAYTVNQIRVTDYFTPSNVQSLFSHQNLQGSLEIDISGMDTSYDEFELVAISYIGEKTNAQKVGTYSTRQRKVFIDILDPRLPVIPLENIPLQTPSYERSDAMYEVSNYLLRVGVYTKPEFNYQPLANLITPKWVALEVPADYYIKGGNITSYLRDEQYVFFIRWIYNTGQKSASYAIAGRQANSNDRTLVSGADVYETSVGVAVPPQKWQVDNTATITSSQGYAIPEGAVIAEGEMGYFESTERYPDDQSVVWADLCGKNIRFCKFPDNSLIHLSGRLGATIRILGVKFENIAHPLDFEGNILTDIIGYEILRGSREGNKSIIAKGLINNVAEYTIPNSVSTRKGLYPNYPYNDLRTDPFLSAQRVKGGCNDTGYQAMGTYHQDIFTFHSPETQFRNPFLSAQELRVESEEFGSVTGNFEPVFKHPKHKLIRDFALYTSGIVGVGAGLLAIQGKKTTTLKGGSAFNAGITGAGTTVMTSTGNLTAPLSDLTLAAPIGGGIGSSTAIAVEGGVMSSNPVLAAAGGTFLFTYFLGKGTEEAVRIIKGLLPYNQFAYQYNSHGFYSDFIPSKEGNKRRLITESNYLEPYLQEFTADYRVNNLFRPATLILQVNKNIANPSTQDTTRTTIGNLGLWGNPTQQFTTTTSAYYAALKNNIENQYGQLDSVIQIPISQGVLATTPEKKIRFMSPVLFGGDQYINRYTEKSIMFFFNDWMFDQPDGYEFDYNLAYNLPYARYWVNTQDFDISQLMQPFLKTAAGIAIGGVIGSEIGSLLGSATLGEQIGEIAGGAAGVALSMNDFSNAVLPNDYAHLDRNSSDCNTKISFGIYNAYFYLFCNGVRDFFVESELNIAQRDYDQSTASRHYDYKQYTDLDALFKSDIIKAGNNYKYDYSLSVSRLLHNYISWGAVLPRDYDPTIAEQCYSYFPNRIIYSLPQQEELKKDNWTAFLTNNYKDFQRKITAIKNVNKTGAIIYFSNDSPLLFQGVDSLQTDGGIKITIGDGGLFNQAFQSTTNSDVEYEYGACQNRGSIIGTPQGVFSVGANQGKIFQYGNGLEEISRDGNKWWFAQYLPLKLLQDYPDFDYPDNPVIGIGVVSGYDNTNEMIYISKRDYQVKPTYQNKLTYQSGLTFILDGNIPVQLGDPFYFDDASFTISYDPKIKGFVSFHDWIPEAMLPSRNHLLTIKEGGIWKHNSRCDLFCNYYGIAYPFEIEYPVTVSQEVTTLRTIEYQLEAYKYLNDCRDQFHILDENFDRAVVYNSEQCSGLLRLNIKPKNNPYTLNQYPSVGLNGIDILFSKEENKYRFNQFWDAVSDRGEFTGKQYNIWTVSPNGYTKELNTLAIKYSKSALQHKKFRHFTQRLLLRKTVSNDVKYLLKLTNQKQQRSLR